MAQKLGMITVGQSPRTDIVPLMAERIGAHVDIVERGALDGLPADEVASLAPKNDEVRLCTRLSDGHQVVIAKEKIIPLIQEKIDDLNRDAVALIVLLCTGHFPEFNGDALVIEAEKVVDRCVEAVVNRHHTIGLVVPLKEQMNGSRRKLLPITPKIRAVSATPYGSPDETERAAEMLREGGVDLTVLHCMGFTDDHRRVMRQVTRKPVLVANSIVARTVAELLAP